MALRLSPAIFIGIGGTGHAVLSKARRCLLESVTPKRRIEADRKVGELQVPGFQFRLIDLDRNRPGDLSESDPRFETAAEFPELQMPAVQVIQEGVRRDVPRFRHLRPWWPTELSDVLRQRFGDRQLDQAYQTRPFGRAAVFLNAAEIHRSLLSGVTAAARREVRQQAATAFQDLVIEGDVTVNVVASIAGGTGCGMFLDVLALARAAIREARVRTQAVNLFLFLPDLFADVVEHDSPHANVPQANAYGALKELDEFLRGRRFEARYTDNFVVREDRLADYVYLVGGANEKGRAVGRRGEVAEHLAAFAMLLSGGLHGVLNQGRGRDEAFNPRHALPGGLEVSRRYSSFGLRTVKYPREWIQNYGRESLMRALAEELLRQGDVKAEVARIVDGHQASGIPPLWSAESPLLPRLIDAPIGFVNQSSGHYQAVPRRELPGRVKTEYERAREQVEAAAARLRHTAQSSADELESGAGALLIQHLTRLVENKELGIGAARTFLELLEAAIKASREAFATKRNEQFGRRLQPRVVAERHREFAERGTSRLWAWREPVLKPYLADLQGDIRAGALAAKFDALAQGCQVLLDQVVYPTKRRVEALLDTLNECSRRSKERLSQLKIDLDEMQSRGALVGCGREKHRAIEASAQAKAAEKQQAVRTTMANRLRLDLPELEHLVAGWAQELKWFTQGLLDQVGTGRELARWMNEHAEDSVAFWPYDAASHGNRGTRQAMVSQISADEWQMQLGEADAGRLVSLSVAEQDAAVFVSVRDGAPVEHLRGMEDCFRCYFAEDLGKPAGERWPCMILPGSEEWTELFPLDLVEFDYERLISSSEELGLISRTKGGSFKLPKVKRTFASRKKLEHALRTDAPLLESLKAAVMKHFQAMGSTGADIWLREHQGALPANLERSIRNSLGI